MRARDLVALVLAVGLVTAVNAVTLGVLYDAIRSAGPGLSENATQVLTGAFGGIVGVLGAYLGFKAGLQANGLDDDQADADSDPFSHAGP